MYSCVWLRMLGWHAGWPREWCIITGTKQTTIADAIEKDQNPKIDALRWLAHLLLLFLLRELYLTATSRRVTKPNFPSVTRWKRADFFFFVLFFFLWYFHTIGRTCWLCSNASSKSCRLFFGVFFFFFLLRHCRNGHYSFQRHVSIAAFSSSSSFLEKRKNVELEEFLVKKKRTGGSELISGGKSIETLSIVSTFTFPFVVRVPCSGIKTKRTVFHRDRLPLHPRTQLSRIESQVSYTLCV